MTTPVIDPQSGVTPPPLPTARPAAQVQLKSPGLAFLLSLLFPGMGQVYNGQPAKALGFFFAFASAIYAVAEISPLPFALFIPFVYLYNIVDAWRTGVLINNRGTAAALPEEDVAESPAWGAGLVLLGFVFLFHNLGWLDLSRLSRLWPALLIIVGAAVLYRSMRQGKRIEKDDGASL